MKARLDPQEMCGDGPEGVTKGNWGGGHEAALVCKDTVRANQNVPSDCLPKDLNAEDVGDDLFCFLPMLERHDGMHPIEIGVNEGNVVITRNTVSKR